MNLAIILSFGIVGGLFILLGYYLNLRAGEDKEVLK
jgi:hypothetical protein